MENFMIGWRESFEGFEDFFAAFLIGDFSGEFAGLLLVLADLPGFEERGQHLVVAGGFVILHGEFGDRFERVVSLAVQGLSEGFSGEAVGVVRALSGNPFTHGVHVLAGEFPLVRDIPELAGRGSGTGFAFGGSGVDPVEVGARFFIIVALLSQLTGLL